MRIKASEEAAMKQITLVLLGLVNIGGYTSAADPAADIANDGTIMNPARADAVLNKYITADENRGGLCLIGFNPGATLHYGYAASASDAKIEFVGKFGKPLLFGKALTLDGIKIESETRRVTVDAKQLKAIKIIGKRVQNLRKWCPNVNPDFLVVLKPIDSLPSDAEVAINVNARDELDELMAALTYLSPDARIKGKSRM